MSNEDNLVLESARRLFGGLADPAWLHGSLAEWPAAKWRQLSEQGLPLGLVREEDGGFGLSQVEMLSVIRLAGYHALPLPLGETMVAARLVAAAGGGLPEGPLSFASPAATDGVISGGDGVLRTSGMARAIPWARHAERILVALAHAGGTAIVALARGAFAVTPGATLAGEPCDTIRWDVEIDGVQARLIAGDIDLELAGAAIRTLAIAGAVERLLDMTTRYALDRQQFGRALTQFQAIQQHLAILAGQAVVCRTAADSVAEALFTPTGGRAIAMAKARASEAAGLAASIAHQVHGAIGFSDEHDLHLFSKRLWTWREEFGSEHWWNRLIGSEIAAEGAPDIWSWLTQRETA